MLVMTLSMASAFGTQWVSRPRRVDSNPREEDTEQVQSGWGDWIAGVVLFLEVIGDNDIY